MNRPSYRLSEPCQICGSDDAEFLYHQRFAGFSANSLLKHYVVVACNRCGFLFADDLPPVQDFERYYGEMSKYEFPENAGRQTAFDLNRFDAALQLCQPFLPAKNRPIADLGCATGGLLNALKQQRFTNLLGADPSEGCVSAMQRLYGIPGVVSTFEALSLPDQSFDFLFLIGVLEHLRHPLPVLAKLVRLLRPGGYIYIDVPDALRFTEFDDAPYQQFSTEHIAYFTPGSLRNIASAVGLKQMTAVQEDRQYSRATAIPSVAGIFRREDAAPEIIADEAGRRQIKAYIDKSRQREDLIRQDLRALAESREPVVVWGAGTHTQHLIEEAQLGDLNIVAFVDNNTRYHDKTMMGLPIVPPAFLADRSERVLVSSRVFELEIAEQLRREFPSTEPILLYRVAA